jgi:pimeloyl-ACP methyl ester carboxylesterase
MLVNGVEICVDTTGDPTDPAVLLVGGRCSSMDWWEPEFCARLAAGGRYVIRYDHRDTGQSVSCPPGAPGYTFADLVADAVGVLDALHVDRAHVVGFSMGGAIAQLMTLDHPARVRALTLMCTASMVATDHEPSEDTAEPAESADEPAQSFDRVSAVEQIVTDQRDLAAPSREFDEPAARALAELVVDRTVNLESSMRNHFLMGSGYPAGYPASLTPITAPTLVLYGAEDPMFAETDAESLAAAIPGATLVPLPHNGHEIPRQNWPLITRALLGHG